MGNCMGKLSGVGVYPFAGLQVSVSSGYCVRWRFLSLKHF